MDQTVLSAFEALHHGSFLIAAAPLYASATTYLARALWLNMRSAFERDFRKVRRILRFLHASDPIVPAWKVFMCAGRGESPWPVIDAYFKGGSKAAQHFVNEWMSEDVRPVDRGAEIALNFKYGALCLALAGIATWLAI